MLSSFLQQGRIDQSLAKDLRLSDPYMRAMVNYLAGGTSWEVTINDTELPLLDRIVLAIRFVNDSAVRPSLSVLANLLRPRLMHKSCEHSYPRFWTIRARLSNRTVSCKVFLSQDLVLPRWKSSNNTSMSPEISKWPLFSAQPSVIPQSKSHDGSRDIGICWTDGSFTALGSCLI